VYVGSVKNLSELPFPLHTCFEEEVSKNWDEDWGAQSEINKLKAVLLCRPGNELKEIDDEVKWAWRGKTDIQKAQEEHDDFAEILRKEGVKVNYMHRVAPNKAKSYFTRDYGVVVNGGAIVARMSLEIRRGEERPAAERLIQLGVPVLRTIHGRGTFEGGDAVFLNEKTLCIGRSIRTNEEGIKQLSEVVSVVGIEEIVKVPIPGYYSRWPPGYCHLDIVFTVVDEKKALIYPEGVPFWFIKYLQRTGIELIEAPPEEVDTMGTNVLSIRPGRVVMVAENDKTRKALEKAGVDVIEVLMRELQKGGGGPRCCTLPLLREH
jgi:N-dimethylarginine dimethylaminohydrolase